MITFNNLDELKQFLQREHGQRTTSPVRFINVDSLSDWFDMKNFLGTLATKFVSLSDYCSSDDTFPNTLKLCNDLERETQNISVLPLSEFLRVNPDRAEREVNLFLNLFPNGIYSFRVYLLMYRLKDLFMSLTCTDPRKKNCILMLPATDEDNYSLTIIQKPMQLRTAGKHVDGFKQYFKCREELPGASVTLYTENAIYLQNKRFFDDVKVIANAFDLLCRQYSLPVEFKRTFGRDEDWQQLAERVMTSGSFERAFCEEFKIDTFDKSVFKNFDELGSFKQWLLWLRCKLQGSDYVARCANAADSPKEFVAQIYEQIFSCADDKAFDELCKERRAILSLMKALPSESFLERVRQTDKRFALKILTSHSQAERRVIFETLKRFKCSESDEAQKILQRTFPEAANYLLNGAIGLTEAQADYFRHYRWLKITNQITKEFNRRVTTLAHNAGENIYALKSRNEIVSEEYSDKASIFFVDGLGAEYINFLAADFSSLEENFSVKYQVGRCNLPSVTENNKDFLAKRKVAGELLELDTLKHESRPYPENILGELNILAIIKEEILRILAVNEKVLLCSDHGASRLAILARQTKCDTAFSSENRKVYKSGRFAESLPNDAKNFPTALEHDGKTIFADYARFVQKGTPGNEIHGGASLEEILVPVITIEHRN